MGSREYRSSLGNAFPTLREATTMSLDNSLLLDGGVSESCFAAPLTLEGAATAEPDEAVAEPLPERSARKTGPVKGRRGKPTSRERLLKRPPQGGREPESPKQRPAAPSQREELILGHLWLVRHVIGRLFPSPAPGV